MSFPFLHVLFFAVAVNLRAIIFGCFICTHFVELFICHLVEIAKVILLFRSSLMSQIGVIWHANGEHISYPVHQCRISLILMAEPLLHCRRPCCRRRDLAEAELNGREIICSPYNSFICELEINRISRKKNNFRFDMKHS